MNEFVPQNGDFFISQTDTYEEVKMLHCYQEKEDNNKLYAYYYSKAIKGKKAEFPKMPLDNYNKPYFPSFLYRKNDLSVLEEMFLMYCKINKEIEDYLIKKKNYTAPISDILIYLVNEFNEKNENAILVIKVLIAENLVYNYKKLNSGEFLSFSDLKSNSEKSKLYYGSLAEEIKVKSDKISLLVSHGQTVGNYRELILRELLKKHIPLKFKIATGFIEGVPKQLDIIIYDSQNYSPTFIEGDLVVIRREAVRAIIEVKSNLDTQKLKDSLVSFYDILRPGLYKPDLPLFKGVFAFDTSYIDTNSIAQCIKEFYNNPYFVEDLQENMIRDVMYLYHEVTCVTILNKHCIFSQYEHANGIETANVIPHLLSISDEREIDIQTSMFFALLFDYLDVDYYAKKSTLKAFSMLHRSKTANIKIETKLTEDDWFPRTASKNEHNFKQESIKNRLSKIDDWFNGIISTTEYLKDLEK